MVLQTSQALHDSLEQLEVALETPFVPSDLENWIAAVESSADSVAGQLALRISKAHDEVFDEIVEEDPGLEHRVRQLKDEDGQTQRQLEAFRDEVRDMRKKVAAVEPDEAAIVAELQQLSDRGLAVVIHIRKQEVALRTWLVESMERDSGTVD